MVFVHHSNISNMNFPNMNLIIHYRDGNVKQCSDFLRNLPFSTKSPKNIPFPFPAVLWYTGRKIKGDNYMNLMDQIGQWYQAGRHELTVDAVLSLPGSCRTDRLLGELVLAYNNLGQYSRALLVLDELKPRLGYTWPWQYRRGYALYYSAQKTADVKRASKLLGRAREAFLAAMKLNPPEHIRAECLEFLRWIHEDGGRISSMT